MAISVIFQRDSCHGLRYISDDQHPCSYHDLPLRSSQDLTAPLVCLHRFHASLPILVILVIDRLTRRVRLHPVRRLHCLEVLKRDAALVWRLNALDNFLA